MFHPTKRFTLYLFAFLRFASIHFFIWNIWVQACAIRTASNIYMTLKLWKQLKRHGIRGKKMRNPPQEGMQEQNSKKTETIWHWLSSPDWPGFRLSDGIKFRLKFKKTKFPYLLDVHRASTIKTFQIPFKRYKNERMIPTLEFFFIFLKRHG